MVSADPISATSPTSSFPPDTLWYLAYGSNMNPKVLTGRRKIRPLESKLVIVPDYWLSFDIGGMPFMEPCFASILKMDRSRIHDKHYAKFVHDHCRYGQEFLWDENQPEKSYPPTLQGVAVRITTKEWQMLIQSEGGWGHDIPTGYDQIQVPCIVTDGRQKEIITAHVLSSRPLSIHARCQPSQRYKDLLLAGAAHHGMDPAYQEYLARVVPYECSGRRAEIGRSVFSVFQFPVMLAFKMLVSQNEGKPADQHSQPPYWIAWYFDKSSRFASAAHDYLIAPMLGSGRCSTEEQQRIMRKMIQDKLVQDRKEVWDENVKEQ